jgi:hypothetical protein
MHGAHACVYLQGLFNILDNKEKDGGFHCVAGAHHHIFEWAKATKDAPIAENPDSNFNFLDWYMLENLSICIAGHVGRACV